MIDEEKAVRPVPRSDLGKSGTCRGSALSGRAGAAAAVVRGGSRRASGAPGEASRATGGKGTTKGGWCRHGTRSRRRGRGRRRASAHAARARARGRWLLASCPVRVLPWGALGLLGHRAWGLRVAWLLVARCCRIASCRCGCAPTPPECVCVPSGRRKPGASASSQPPLWETSRWSSTMPVLSLTPPELCSVRGMFAAAYEVVASEFHLLLAALCWAEL